MPRLIRERLIAASPDRIWPPIDDVAQLSTWFSFADRMEVLEGTGLGRRQRLHGHWGKQQSEIDQRVVAYEPPSRIAWKHEAERLDGKPAPRFVAETVFTIELTRQADATLVRLTSDQRPAGPLQGMVDARNEAGHDGALLAGPGFFKRRPIDRAAPRQ